jgi:hypothetical protein
MDNLLEQIKSSRGVRDITINNYKRHINKLSMKITDEPFKSISFLKTKYDDVIEYLSQFSLSVQRAYAAAIMVFLTPNKKGDPPQEYKEVYDKYMLILKDGQKSYLDSKANNKMSEKELTNWMDYEDIVKIRDNKLKELKKKKINVTSTQKLNNKDFNLLQQYVVLSLYTMMPPRRNDYAVMKIVNKKQYNSLNDSDKKNNNYLINNSKVSKQFSYGTNAVKSGTGDNDTQIINIPKDLNSVLNLWLNYNKTDNLLVIVKDGEYISTTRNNLTEFINRIFKPYNKSISTSMLRKIYLTYMFPEEVDIKSKKQKIAEQMNHSISVQQNLYVKDV